MTKCFLDRFLVAHDLETSVAQSIIVTVSKTWRVKEAMERCQMPPTTRIVHQPLHDIYKDWLELRNSLHLALGCSSNASSTEIQQLQVRCMRWYTLISSYRTSYMRCFECHHNSALCSTHFGISCNKEKIKKSLCHSPASYLKLVNGTCVDKGTLSSLCRCVWACT